MARVLQPFYLDAEERDVAAGTTLTIGVEITLAQAVALAAGGHIALESVSADPAPDPTEVIAAAGRDGLVRVVALAGFSLGGGADVAKASALMVNEATADLWVKQGRVVRAAALTATYAGLDTMVVGETVAAALAIVNGCAPFAVTVVEDQGDGLAAGLEFDEDTFAIAGEPEAEWTGDLVIRIVDASGDSAEVTVPQVVAAALAMLPASLSAITDAEAVDTTIAASGGFAPYAYSAVGLPSGMTLDAGTGALEWDTPTATGSPHTFTVTATDAAGHSAAVEYSLVVTEA